MNKPTPLLIALALLALPQTRALASVTAAPLFSDHAVLQQDVPVPVWGNAAPGEKVTVSFASQTKTATAGTDGVWKLTLDALKPGLSGELTIAGSNTLKYQDVVTGEVWLCSGQSNMAWVLSQDPNGKENIAAADNPAIRQFSVPFRVSVAELPAKGGEWMPCSPKTAGRFSAVAYFFAREINEDRKTPVGIINCSKGGSPVEAWIGDKTLHDDPQFEVVFKRWKMVVDAYPQRLADFKAQTASATPAASPAAADDKAPEHAPAAPRAPLPPHEPSDPAKDFQQPSGLYGGMLHGLAPYAVRGVLWYQGETNVGRAPEYGPLFESMIKEWRKDWDNELPFYWMQLPKIGKPNDKSITWAALREAQAQALELPKTGMAVTVDLGNATLHPPDKTEFGHRLALVARAGAYGETLTASGPVYKGREVKGNVVRLTFDQVGKGLKTLKDGAPLAGFETAGDDKAFKPAKAAIEKNQVVVTAEGASTPAAVRYAFSNNPEDANLTNDTGLPARPFRTDDWPLSMPLTKTPPTAP